MIKKLKDKSGESIAETLMTTVIAALAIVLLLSGLAASGRMMTASEGRVDAEHREIENVNKGAVDDGVELSKDYTLNLKFTNCRRGGLAVESLTDRNFKVDVYSSEHGIVRYEKAK